MKRRPARQEEQSAKKLSIARRTRPVREVNDVPVDAAEDFYTQGLGLQVLYQYCVQDRLSLLMLGLPGTRWHLELTRNVAHAVCSTLTPEDLLTS